MLLFVLCYLLILAGRMHSYGDLVKGQISPWQQTLLAVFLNDLHQHPDLSDVWLVPCTPRQWLVIVLKMDGCFQDLELFVRHEMINARPLVKPMLGPNLLLVASFVLRKE